MRYDDHGPHFCGNLDEDRLAGSDVFEAYVESKHNCPSTKQLDMLGDKFLPGYRLVRHLKVHGVTPLGPKEQFSGGPMDI